MNWMVLTLSCTPKSPPAAAPLPVETPITAEAAASAVGVDSPLLQSLLADHWDATMERYPTWASRLGDLRFQGQLYDPSDAAHSAWLRREQAWTLQASALPDEALSPRDRLTRDLLLEELRTSLAREVCRTREWSVSARNNALVGANRLAERPRLDTNADADALLARYRLLPTNIGISAENLRAGLAAGRVGNVASIERVVAMIEAQLADPVSGSPLLNPRDEIGAREGAEAWKADLEAVVADEIRPALAAYLDVVRDEILPAARTGSDIGLHALPDGTDCYAALIRAHTTLDTTADALHQLGLDQLAGIHDEFRTLGAGVLQTEDLAEIFDRLRTDPDLYFEEAEEIQTTAEAALDRASAAMGDWFGRLPEAECVVEPVPDYLAPYTTIAYYQQPRPDGTRPGTYSVNVHAPTTRPRHEAEVLAFHESIPGHHLQIAIAQELPDLPAFRRHGGVTAFVEGWALYTERLSDEMGLYTADVDRLGMLSFDAWRAARLVVDTGIHAKGWDRETAIAFLTDNTPLALNNIDNEVDRYITTPGQALAYKVGQLEIVRLRRRAEATLGPQFDIAAFHDQILDAGPLPLPLLAERVERWTDRTAEAAGLDVSPPGMEPN